jgi:radical SAM superfamily enzyme YgiQ (UPF0313 family)
MGIKGSKLSYRVALITVTQMDIAITAIAGVLKSKGIPAMLINLQTDETGDPLLYPQKVVDQVLDLLKGVNYIGISVHDMFFRRACFLSGKIKAAYPNSVIAMGGIHAELYPEECLEVPSVDAVCIGDGYYAFLDLITNWNKRESVGILNTWIRLKNGEIKKPHNIQYLSSSEIDALPMPDYTYDHYWLLADGTDNLRWMGDYFGVYSFRQHQIGHKNTYVVSFMTGCAHRCSYCNNWSRFLKYQANCGAKAPRIRYKSPERMIEELKFIKKFHKVKFIYIADNDLCIRSLEEIKRFSQLYKEYINLPMYVQVSPDTLTEKKLQYLIEAGLVELNMGVQTIGRININMYNRNITDKTILEVTQMINKYVIAGQVDAFYDFIIFNAAMTRKDLLDMIAFIRKIPAPFDQVSHHLTLGPAVELYQRFKDEGVVYTRDLKKMYESNYHEFDFTEYKTFPNFYLNLILEWMAGRHDEEFVGRLPRSAEQFLTQPWMDKIKFGNKELSDQLCKNANIYSDIRDFLISEGVENALSKNIEILQLITNALPELLYTNQRQGGVYKDA